MRRTKIVRLCLAGLFLLGAASVVYAQCRHCVDPVQKSMNIGPNCAYPGTAGMECGVMFWTETEELTGPIPTSQSQVNAGCDSRQSTLTEARTKTIRNGTCMGGVCLPLGPPLYAGTLMIHPCASPNCEIDCGD